MKQLFLNKEKLIIKEAVQPLIHESSLLIAVQYIYITAQTDITAIETEDSFFNNTPHKVKRVLEAVALQADEVIPARRTQSMAHGYASVGQVISVGKKVTKFGPGDFVACLSYSPQSDIICVPDFYAVKIVNPDHLQQATLIPFAAGSLQVLRHANIQIGQWVGVFGLNLIGLLTVQLAKIAGCSVVAIDNDPNCLALADALGASMTLHMTRDEIDKEINLVTEHHGLNTVFLTNNEPSFFDLATKVTGKNGKLVLLGEGVTVLQQASSLRDMNIIVVEDIFEWVTTDNAALSERTDNRSMRTCLDLMEKEILLLDPLIKEQFPIEKLSYAYQRIKNKTSVGALLTYVQSTGQAMVGETRSVAPQSISEEKRFIPAICDDLRVGFIGMSNFTKTTVLPLITTMRNLVITSFFDENVRKPIDWASQQNAVQWVPKEEILTSDLCDVIVIATSHVLHADHALQALQQGKAVFLEKPMATDFNQLRHLISYLQEHKNAPLCVGYSYSFAPFIQKIKKVIERRRTPLMAYYRLNRELNYDEWQMTHPRMNAGRIIGDTCQIIDLFCYLTDSFPISVSVGSMHSARDDIFPTDNVTTNIIFNDGSVCSFLYTTLGHPDIGTDRLEIYYDGKVILMEDFMELYGFGFSSWFNDTLTKANRGYEAMVRQFFKLLHQETFNPLIPINRLQMVAQLTLIIDELACGGGGKKEISYE